MGPFDPVIQAQKLAALVARSDGDSFVLTTTTTSILRTAHPLQSSFLPVTGSRLLVAWSAVYKGSPWSGSLVCDTVVKAAVSAAMLDHASTVFDLVDLRRSAYGLNSPPGPDIHMP